MGPDDGRAAARAIRGLLAAVENGVIRATPRDLPLLRRLEGAALALEMALTRHDPETPDPAPRDPETRT
jgi:hypothetical protein